MIDCLLDSLLQNLLYVHPLRVNRRCARCFYLAKKSFT